MKTKSPHARWNPKVLPPRMKAPERSWWADPLDWSAFTDEAKKAADRMALRSTVNDIAMSPAGERV